MDPNGLNVKVFVAFVLCQKVFESFLKSCLVTCILANDPFTEAYERVR